MSSYTHKGHTMLISSIIAYIARQFNLVEETGTYGTELEKFIVSKNPQSTADIEHWAQQFNHARNTKGWL